MRRPGTNGRGSRMALCLWWPGFELELERARAPRLEGHPLALPDVSSGTRRSIDRACGIARREGVEHGMLLSRAIALCPSLVLCEPDPDFYGAVGERIFDLLARWSPVVQSSADRGRFFAGVDGLERLYGPPGRQIAELRARLESLSPHLASEVRLGYAPGTFAAWVAARSARRRRATSSTASGPGRPSERAASRSGSTARPAAASVVVSPADLPAFLARQPVGVLPVSPRMVRRLERLGIARLGDLAALPEPALVAQFGADGRRALAWATGRRIDRVRPEARERPIRVALDFPSPVGQLEMLHAGLDRLLARALERSRRRGRSVRGVRLGARLEDGGSWSLRAILREPTSDPERLAAILRSRIALSPPQRAVERLRLEFFRFGPASAQTGLFDPKADAPRASGSIETRDGEVIPAIRRAARMIRLRLGEAALYRVLELQPASRLPERRHALVEVS